MKLQFINRFLDTGVGGALLGGAASLIPGVAAVLPIVQGILGTIQSTTGANRARNLLQRRQSYRTPEEYFQILNATSSLAGQGFDPFTLNYLTGETDRAFGASIGAATRLGGDPNLLSQLFDQKMQGVLKIGAENATRNLENFTKYLGALDVIGQNKAAEQKSQQDLLKDQLQAAVGDKREGIQNIINAANAYLGLAAAHGTSGLFRGQPESTVEAPTSSGVTGAATPNISVTPDVRTGSQGIRVPNRPASLYGG